MLPSFGWIGDVPDAFYDPHILTLTSLMNGFPSREFFAILDGIILTSTVMLTVGLFTRCSTFSLLVAILVGNHFSLAFGKIDHGILVLCTLFAMLFSDWGRLASLDGFMRPSRKEEAARPCNLVLLAIFVSFAFFTAGYGKAMVWIDFDATKSGFLSWLYPNYFVLGRKHLLASAAMGVRPLWLWEIADVSAVIFELGFFFALFRRRLWFAWLALASVFHLLNTLILNISFLPHAIVYTCFVPWTELFPRVTRFARKPAGLFIVTTLSLACVVVSVGVSGGSGSVFWKLTGLSRVAGADLVVASVIWSLVGILLCVCALKAAPDTQCDVSKSTGKNDTVN